MEQEITGTAAQRAVMLARHFFDQNNFQRALQESQKGLAANPENGSCINLAAVSLARLSRFREAEEMIMKAIATNPTTALYHYSLSHIMALQFKLDNSEFAIKSALSLDSGNASFYSQYALILYHKQQWAQALEFINKSLAIEPQEAAAENLKARIYQKMGDTGEAIRSSAAALEKDPENSASHTTLAWSLMEKREVGKSLEHFSRALAIDPINNSARNGMKEALKARNIIYRMFQDYSVWMSRKTPKSQWGIIFATVLLVRILSRTTINLPHTKVVLVPVICLLVSFMIGTWLIADLSNLLLRFNKYGRLLLSKDELEGSAWVGQLLTVAIGAGLLYAFTGGKVFAELALTSACLSIPAGQYYRFEPDSSNRTNAGWITGALGFVSLLAIIMTYLSKEVLNIMTFFCLFGLMGFQWWANSMTIRKSG